MSDTVAGGNEEKSKIGKFFDSPFVTFSKPYLDLLDKVKIFGIVYIVFAVGSLITPFVVLYLFIDSGMFSFGAKWVFFLILSWMVITFSCWIQFQIWWNRKKNLEKIAESEFRITPIFCEILQTSGECLGTFMGIVGAGCGLLALIFLGSEANNILYYIDLGILGNIGVVAFIIAGPVSGFFTIITFKFIAEQLRLFVSLVNNTKEIALNVKK